jgi:serine/threonine protein kinase
MSSDPQNESATLIHEALSKAPLVGSTLNNRYTVERELKRGGFGIVYLARDKQLHSRPVVVKVLLEDAYQSDYVVQKFRQEIEALSRIDHPGVVGIVDSGELSNGKPFIVMQYVDGVTLRSVMTPEGMDLERSADLIKQMGRALTAAHEKGIFHRDLKPDNVMLQDLGQGEEQVKIIDFGIAKIKNSVIAPSTATNVAAGTVAYMAPEQLSGRPVSAVTDVYALGQIAYEMVTGRRPFNPETGFELLEMQRGGVRVKPSDLRPSLSPRADELILQAISFEPANRQSKARDFGDKLARALNAELETAEHRPRLSELQPTQMPMEATPPAVKPGAYPEKTIRATLPISSQFPQDGYAVAEVQNTLSRRRSLTVILVAISVVALGLVGWYLFAKNRKPANVAATSTTASPRQLSYSLTVQKMREGRPYQDQFESSGHEIFENGWKFRLNLKSGEQGQLYLLNEGPGAGGVTTFNVLFPAPSANSGSSEVGANQNITTPWMVFDKNQGTEKFWLVWSTKPVAELEAVKGFVNERDRGTINDPSKADTVRAFLVSHNTPKPEVEKDKTKKQTNVRGKGDILVNVIELEHH